MMDVLKVLNPEKGQNKEKEVSNEHANKALFQQMQSKVLCPYKPGFALKTVSELLNLEDSEKFSFEELIKNQWFGVNYFQVFVKKSESQT